MTDFGRIGFEKNWIHFSLFFEGALVLSLSAEWLLHFERIPEFEVTIDSKNKIHFISKESVKLPS